MKLSALQPRQRRIASLSVALAIAAACSTTPALAAPFIDAQGDFLPSYAGPKDPDLDVRFADVIIDPQAGTATFFGILAGPIDKASGKFYVFGVDRGRGEAGRDLVFEGAAGGEPKIGHGVRWDAAIGLLANGTAVFFDALNPGVVPLPNVAVRVAGSEISATVPLSLLPSQGFSYKDYTFNLWPRSQVSLANTTVADFAPDNSSARVSIVGKRTAFAMSRSGKAESARCIAQASADVTIHSLGSVEVMEVSLHGLPAQSTFNLFALQLANAPFGLGSYLGDIETNKQGQGHQRFVGRFSQETFTVAPGSGIAPSVHSNAFPDAQLNPPTGPVHQYHLGLWFNTPADAVKAGCPGDVTPFSGEHTAGIQALSTRSFADLQGPLRAITP
ncbi:MAG TPA: hypothetical protein VLD35_20245 [Caldimonas sp.]|nr:hypothetical protein [Caldimonas sp.]